MNRLKSSATHCIICLSEELGSVVTGVIDTCGHSFCDDCITRWLKVTPACPLCRTHATRVTIVLPHRLPSNAGNPIVIHDDDSSDEDYTPPLHGRRVYNDGPRYYVDVTGPSPRMITF